MMLKMLWKKCIKNAYFFWKGQIFKKSLEPLLENIWEDSVVRNRCMLKLLSYYCGYIKIQYIQSVYITSFQYTNTQKRITFKWLTFIKLVENININLKIKPESIAIQIRMY